MLILDILRYLTIKLIVMLNAILFNSITASAIVKWQHTQMYVLFKKSQPNLLQYKTINKLKHNENNQINNKL